MKEEIKNKGLIIWAMVLISVLSIIVLAHFLCLVFKNIDKRITYVLVAGCVSVIITSIICLTIIVCKCLSTRCERSNSYDDALTEMLVSHNKKCTQGNSPSIANQNLIVSVDSSTNTNITIN